MHIEESKVILLLFNSNTNGNFAGGEIGIAQMSEMGNLFDNVENLERYLLIVHYRASYCTLSGKTLGKQPVFEHEKNRFWKACSKYRGSFNLWLREPCGFFPALLRHAASWVF